MTISAPTAQKPGEACDFRLVEVIDDPYPHVVKDEFIDHYEAFMSGPDRRVAVRLS
jgi:hypothetical protein